MKNKKVIIVFSVIIGVVLAVVLGKNLVSSNSQHHSDHAPLADKYLIAQYHAKSCENLKVFQKDHELVFYSYNTSEDPKLNDQYQVYKMKCDHKITKDDIKIIWEDQKHHVVSHNSPKATLMHVKVHHDKQLVYEGECNHAKNHCDFKDGMKHHPVPAPTAASHAQQASEHHNEPHHANQTPKPAPVAPQQHHTEVQHQQPQHHEPVQHHQAKHHQNKHHHQANQQ